MKKYFFTMAVMVVFAIGFSASDEYTDDTSSPSVEQNEQKSSENESNDKIKEVKERAQFYGKSWATSSPEMREYKPLDDIIKGYYIDEFDAPQSDEDYRMYSLFKEEFLKKYNATLNAESNM